MDGEGQKPMLKETEQSRGKSKLLKLGTAGVAVTAGIAYLTTLFAHDSNPKPVQPTPEPQKASDTLPSAISNMEDLRSSQLNGQAQLINAKELKVEAEAEENTKKARQAESQRYYGPPPSLKK